MTDYPEVFKELDCRETRVMTPNSAELGAPDMRYMRLGAFWKNDAARSKGNMVWEANRLQ